MRAASVGSLPVVECLVSHGADLDATNHVRVLTCVDIAMGENPSGSYALMSRVLLGIDSTTGWQRRVGNRGSERKQKC